jgi:hypothetical protein
MTDEQRKAVVLFAGMLAMSVAVGVLVVTIRGF